MANRLPMNNPPWWQKYSTLLIWAVLLLTFLIVPKLAQQDNSVSYSQFKNELKNSNLTKVVMEGEKITYTTKEDKKYNTVMLPVGDDELVKELESKGVDYKAISGEPSMWTALLINFLPWLLIFGFFFWSSRRITSGAGKGMGPLLPGMGRSKEMKPSESKTKFDDVAGLEGAKTDLLEIVDYLKHPENYAKIGAKLPKGVLLMGPPGTGKTLMAKAVAGEAGVAFFSISGSEFIELYVGMGASRVRQLFEQARTMAPAIIFIDEIDSIGRTRGTGLGGGHDEREQTLNQILAEMDGFNSTLPIVVMAATNRPDVLDPALVRPGRFDRQISVDLPMQEARQKILAIHCRKVPLESDVDLQKISQMTVGFSGADLANLVNEAALYCARRKGEKVSAKDFSMARDKVLMGNPRETKLSEQDKKVVAYHEAGHALVAMKSEGADPVQKITILPRGRALGFTEQRPTEDRINMKKSAILTNIRILLGGRSSEKLIFSDVTTGAEDDLKRATKLARKMVMNWGMSDEFGCTAFESGEDHPFLGMEMTKPKNFSEKTAELIDAEIQRILKEQKEQVDVLLKNNRSLLDALANSLLSKETLELHDIEAIAKEYSA
ncbi:MAG: ATP-dependent zinc metalloprotease FtsH [Bdellovibrio sp.]